MLHEVDRAPSEAGSGQARRHDARRPGRDLDQGIQCVRRHLEPLAQRGMGRREEATKRVEATRSERRLRLNHPPVLGNDVERSSIGNFVHPLAVPLEHGEVDVAQRSDAGLSGRDRGNRPAAFGTTGVVGRCFQAAWASGMADDEIDLGRDWHRAPVQRPAVEKQGLACLPHGRRELIHEPTHHADVLVLGTLRRAGERHGIEAGAGLAGEGPGGRKFECRRRGQPGTGRDRGLEHASEAPDRETGIPQGPRGPGDVVQPGAAPMTDCLQIELGTLTRRGKRELGATVVCRHEREIDR